MRIAVIFTAHTLWRATLFPQRILLKIRADKQKKKKKKISLLFPPFSFFSFSFSLFFFLLVTRHTYLPGGGGRNSLHWPTPPTPSSANIHVFIKHKKPECFPGLFLSPDFITLVPQVGFQERVTDRRTHMGLGGFRWHFRAKKEGNIRAKPLDLRASNGHKYSGKRLQPLKRNSSRTQPYERVI